MNTPNSLYSLAQMRAYLMGDAPPELAQRLETDMVNDPLLVGAMERLEAELDKEAASPEALTSLEEAFRDAIPHANSQQRMRPIWQPIAIAVAASLALLIGTVLWTQPTEEGLNAEALFAINFTPYEDLLTVRAHPEDSLTSTTMSQYNEGNYPEAISGFQQLLATDSAAPLLRLYLANSLLAIDQPGAALEQLSLLQQTGGSAVQSVAQWYSAMAYLQQGNKPEASIVLENLASSGGIYGEKAQAILKAW